MEIKIIRGSIRPNPKAGQTSQTIQGRRNIDCVITGKFPDILKDNVNCHVLTETFAEPKEYRVALFNDSIIDDLLKAKDAKIIIETKIDHQRVYFPPLPRYLYEYENPSLKCSDCGSMVLLKDIKQDCNDDGCYTICPACNNIETFEPITYESIDDIEI